MTTMHEEDWNQDRRQTTVVIHLDTERLAGVLWGAVFWMFAALMTAVFLASLLSGGGTSSSPEFCYEALRHPENAPLVCPPAS